MDKLIELFMDMGRLWDTYHMQYLIGIRNTLILAVAATLIGFLIGLVCGILNTIPYTRQDHVVKRFFLKLIRAVFSPSLFVLRHTRLTGVSVEMSVISS